MKRHHAVLAGVLTTAAATLALAVPPALAHDGHVDLSRPGSLDRGDDIRIPHVEGTTLVDGDLRIEIDDAIYVFLAGPSLDGYLVSTSDGDGGSTVTRVERDGTQTVLLDGRAARGLALLSEDGTQFVTERFRRGETTIVLRDATTGAEEARRTFQGTASPLAAADGDVVVGSWDRKRTFAWNVDTDTRTVIARGIGYQADAGADRLAYFTKDPYLGGCSVIVPLSQPKVQLWKSCKQLVAAFSPGGERMATFALMTDGVGPGEVQLREFDGTRLVRYEANWFGDIRWEDDATLLLDARGKRKGATVRCLELECERASDLETASP